MQMQMQIRNWAHDMIKFYNIYKLLSRCEIIVSNVLTIRWEFDRYRQNREVEIKLIPFCEY